MVPCISESILNVLNGIIKPTGCDMSMLQKHKAALSKVSDKRVPLTAKTKLIVQRGGFLLPLLSADLPSLANLIFRNR